MQPCGASLEGPATADPGRRKCELARDLDRRDLNSIAASMPVSKS